MRFIQIIVLLNIYQLAIGQSAKVLTQNARSSTSSHPLLEIKWYSASFIYKKGCNVYRREQGTASWLKLTNAPIMMNQAVPPEWKPQDPDLETFYAMAKDLTKSSNNGFILLNLFGKSFQSSRFSRLVGIQFDDHTIKWGTTYEYRITTFEKNQETELAVSSPITAGAYVQNKPIQGFLAKHDKNEVKLNWKPDENSFYAVNIYRRTLSDSTWKKLNSQPVVISETKGNPPASDALFIDKNSAEGTVYFYRITGLDFFGEESLPTKEIQIEIGDITPPPAPADIKLKIVKEMKVQISYTPTISEDLAGHYVYRSSKSDGPFNKISPSLSPKTDSLIEDSVPAPGFYYYYVAAADKAGNENPSMKAMVEVKDVIPPSRPQNVIARADTGKIILSWSKNGEADLMGYHVYRSIQNNENGSFALVNSKPLKDSVYVQVLPKNASNSFFFKIVAVDTSYNNSVASEIVSARMPDVIPPVKPIIKNIIARNDSMEILWVANPENDLLGYNLYKYTDQSSERIKINDDFISPSFKSFIDVHREKAGKFYYQLQAIDESKNISLLSDSFPVEIEKKFDYSFSDVSAKFHKRKKAVIITWADSKKSEDVLGFVVFRKDNDNTSWKAVTSILENKEYQDKSIQLKSKYSYQIRAYSKLGKNVASNVIIIKS